MVGHLDAVVHRPSGGHDAALGDCQVIAVFPPAVQAVGVALLPQRVQKDRFQGLGQVQDQRREPPEFFPPVGLGQKNGIARHQSQAALEKAVWAR